MMQKDLKKWYVNVDNIVISKLLKTKANPKYSIGYLDKAVRPLVLIMRKWVDKTFKVEEKNQQINVFPYRWWEAIRKKLSCLE